MTQDKPKHGLEVCHASQKQAAEDVVKICKAHPVTHLEECHYIKSEPIVCKWCGSKDISKHGVSNGVQEYLCQKCGRKFNTKDAPYGMRTTVEEIGASLTMYYNGLSLSDIVQYLNETHHNPVARSTVYRWLIKFTNDAIRLLEPLKPRVSDTWIADEISLKFMDKLFWIWDIIDQDTRFLLATYLSSNRGTKQAQKLMELASKQAGKVPKVVITDKLAAYIDGIEIPFGADTEHIQSSPFAGEDSTSLIERFHGTIKDRTKVIRGFKTFDTAELIIEGFRMHYDFFRPHLSLENHTPAEAAGIKSPVKNWTELVRKVGMIV